jgi:Flp pilus assembly pilin Flp
MNIGLHSSKPSTQRGISAIEYLVLAVVVIGAIATAAGLFGGDISAAFSAIGDLINPP